MLLKDKVVLVTGSTTGIGRAVARRCVAEGASVMLHGRSKDRAQALCKELGPNVDFCIDDLTAKRVPIEIVQKTVKRFGRIDSLINNAADVSRSNIDDMTEAHFDAMMQINLKAPLFLTQAAVKEFRKQKSGGTVVNIGSINAHCGETALLVYSATKGGLMTATRNLGDALNFENIRVNQINVGWTLTENESKVKQGQGFPPDWEKFIDKTLAPRGTLLRPEEIAAHVVFWASDQSAPANGTVYEVEQYPMIGRSFINKLPLDFSKT